MSRIWSDLNAGQVQLYKMCVNLAAKGLPFPSLAEAAAQLDMAPSAVAFRFDALRRRGYLRVDRPSRNLRIVTICATGERTADPRGAEELQADPAPVESESPVRDMVRRTFAEFQATEPYRRAAQATSSLSLAKFESVETARQEFARPVYATNCFKCGAAGACKHRQAN